MTEYRIKDPHKGLIGPVRLETLHDLVRAGVVHDAVLVSRDGGPFKAVTAFPELGHHFRPASIAPQPTYAGDLGRNTFFKVFFRFHATQATGLLVVKDEPRQKDIYLERGHPTYVGSTMPEERLGAFLVRRGLLDPQDLKVALEATHSDGKQLGQALIRLGLMEAKDVFVALREQQTARLVDLCTWEAGRYMFYDAVRYNREKFDLEIRVPDLILHAARDMTETTLLRRLGAHLHAQVVLHQDAQKVIEPLGFSALEQRIVHSVDGKRTGAEIMAPFAGDDSKRRLSLMVLFLLWEIDAATFREPQKA